MVASAQSSASVMKERLVRYSDLKPCTTAFIDTRTPGSAEKENFTIIGPGVAESPDQHVHINIPHGFNIGGARQPPRCINSQHSHETAEVFVVHTGRWAFQLGPNCEDGEVVLEPGDTISIPVGVFRGFKNVGDDVGFLFAVLGGDDPGHVTWAPYVFDNAKEFGLILLDDGSLVDTTKGESIPAGKKPMPATTDTDVARARRLTADQMSDCIVLNKEMTGNSASISIVPGFTETPIIGAASDIEQLSAGKMSWPHGFHVRHLAFDPGVTTQQHCRHEEEVIFVQKGRLTVTVADGDTDLGPGDTLTIPVDMPRAFGNSTSQQTEVFVVRGGDHPKAAKILA
jgi:mannose-6-phosphate isomerase-like protein (cupin superfamily)